MPTPINPIFTSGAQHRSDGERQIAGVAQHSLQQIHALDILMASMRFPTAAQGDALRKTMFEALTEFSPDRPTWFSDAQREVIRKLIERVYSECGETYAAGVDGFRRDDLLLHDLLSSVRLHEKDNPFRHVHELSAADQHLLTTALCHADILPAIRAFNDVSKIDDDDVQGDLGIALDACPEPCRSLLFQSIFGEPEPVEESVPGMGN